jgi:hypothetical protein
MRHTRKVVARLFLSAIAWAVIWGVGGWYFDRFETGKQFDFFIGIPYILPTCIASWGTVRGFMLGDKTGAGIVGAICGTVAGCVIGLLGFFILISFKGMTEGLAFRQVPSWLTVEFIFTLGGATAGFVTGLLVEAVCSSLLNANATNPDTISTTGVD